MTTDVRDPDPLDECADENAETYPAPTRLQSLRRRLKRTSFGLIIAGLLVLFVFIHLWPMMIIAIHSGQEGVLWRRLTGTVTDVVYHEGTHLIMPWNIMYVYDVQIQRADHTVEVLSTDGLEIKVNVSTRYHPVRKTVPQLHQQVGPDYLNRIVIPEIVTAVREVMGKYRPQELYTRRTEEMQDQIRVRAAAQVQDRFVEIDDVLIRRIELPASVQGAIQTKLTLEQESQAYEFRLQRELQEAERKRQEANGIRDFQQIVAQGISPALLRWKGIEATLELAKSPNSKVIVIGSSDGLPLILDTASTTAAPRPPD